MNEPVGTNLQIGAHRFLIGARQLKTGRKETFTSHA